MCLGKAMGVKAPEENKDGIMTCKDCIHYDVCEGWQVDQRGEDLANGCTDFKDKSKYIELPCNIGNKVYIIDPFNGICDMTLRNVHVNDVLKNNIFLTKSEAEQKLKELKENANS